jgi:POT family proton-dependent oligopeptide transporter
VARDPRVDLVAHDQPYLPDVRELSLSPVGLSSMTSSRRGSLSGQRMGVWFLATSLGNVIAGLVGGKVDPEKLQAMPLFRQTSMSLFIAAACAPAHHPDSA